MRLQPWQVIAVPSGLWAIAFFAWAIFKDAGHLAIWATPGMIVLAAAYVLSPQINWWWFKRNPPPLSITATKLLETHFLYYKKLSPEMKTRFRERVALFILGNEFIRPVRSDDSDAQSLRNTVPEDLKAAVAALATQVFFGKTDVPTSKYEHFILYPHPFPTPQYPFLHTSEIYEEDGVVLFSADPLMIGLNNPQAFFSIGIYEFSKIFKAMTPSVSLPILTQNDWSVLEKISSMNQGTIEKVIGFSELDDFGVLAHHFFTFPDLFKSHSPDLFQLLSNMFHQDPTNGMNPIVSY